MRWLAIALLTMVWGDRAAAQIPLYAQRLPDSTVYLRIASALPDATRVQTDSTGMVTLGTGGADRISPYFADQSVVDGAVSLHISTKDETVAAGITVPPGSFVTIVLQPAGGSVTAIGITDHPEYNQLRARLTFYNATPDCPIGSLVEASGRPVFTEVPADGVAARSINPVDATVVAGCSGGQAPPLDLGRLAEGSLTSVWLMRLAGSLVAFAAPDTIAPPRS